MPMRLIDRGAVDCLSSCKQIWSLKGVRSLMPDWAWYLMLIPAGFIAGVVNTIAGGGSFLTLPALMFLCGMDPKIANGTNRVAILFSTVSASATFHRHGHIDSKLAMRLCLPTLFGVPVGALLAITLPADAFRPVFGGIFLAMAILLAFKPKLLVDTNRKPPKALLAELVLFFGIGVYVGFIQAGMGILLLLGISLFHPRELVGANGVKNVIGFVLTLVALGVFIYHEQVLWIPGLIMAVGNVLGGYVGAKLAIKKRNQLIFAFLIVVMIGTGVKLLWSSAAAPAENTDSTSAESLLSTEELQVRLK
jgi:uncharacterized membrane protein YfcA